MTMHLSQIICLSEPVENAGGTGKTVEVNGFRAARHAGLEHIRKVTAALLVRINVLHE